MSRPLEQLVPRRDLDDPTEVHHPDPVADVAHDRQVVGDEQVRQPQLRLQVHQQVEHLRLNRNVERRHRLVADQQIGLERQSPGDADPLALTAGELVRVAIGHRRQQADQVEQFRDPLPEAAATPRHAVDLERFADDLPHPHPRIERPERILEDHLHPPAKRPQPALACLRDVLAVEDDAAGRRLQHAQDRHRRRRLAAAAFPHQAEGLTAPEIERHPVDRLDGSHPAPHEYPFGDREVDLEILDTKQHPVGGGTHGADSPS